MGRREPTGLLNSGAVGGLGCPLQALFPELIRPEVDEVGEGEAS